MDEDDDGGVANWKTSCCDTTLGKTELGMCMLEVLWAMCLLDPSAALPIERATGRGTLPAGESSRWFGKDGSVCNEILFFGTLPETIWSGKVGTGAFSGPRTLKLIFVVPVEVEELPLGLEGETFMCS